MARKVLVTYAADSADAGSVAGLAGTMGAELRSYGHQVDVVELRRVQDLTPYDVVLLGSASSTGRRPRVVVRFLRHHDKALRERQLWMFDGRLAPAAVREWVSDVNAAIEAASRSTWHRPTHPAGHFLG
jgi:menaquinone-dependent protoporphyrinogen oxidase